MPALFCQRLMMFRKRVDLHCHSRASTEADEAVLQAIRCPESYSEPREVYAQAKQRGMDFVTITDHDSIAGVEQLAGLAEVLVGEEVTCYFPEDRCKIHLLVWGIMRANHEALQASADDIYEIAKYVAHHRIAHAVAHPLYRQNGKLDGRHIERLLLMFKGFECLNGAHSMSHREAFEPLLDDLDAMEIRRLERVHGIDALWPTPWIKSRTGGSDDHGLFNIGRTWTEFPDGVHSVQDVLDCLRECRCRPGGEAGSSIKLAHNFYGVGMRYYTREVASSRGGFKSAMMQRMLCEKSSCGRIACASGAINWGARSVLDRIARKLRLKKPARGIDLLHQLFTASAMKRFDRSGPIAEALKQNRAAMAEHRTMFDWICQIDRDVAAGIFDSVMSDLRGGRIGAVFDSLSTIIGHQAMLLPYYFALFLQNQERDLLNKLARKARTGGDALRVGLFTDNTGEDDVAGRFAHDFARYAESRGLRGIVHGISQRPGPVSKCWRNFTPMVDRQLEPLPLNITIPPILEILQWADSQQFDAVLINTCGPMGMCGWLAARMLRAPMLAVCHEDLPARVLTMTGGDYRIGAAASAYVRWLYGGAAKVLVASQAGREAVAKMPGLRTKRLTPGSTVESAWKACAAAAADADFGDREARPMVREFSDAAMEEMAV
jgi:Glycosyltransferase Family 4/PHP-associated